MQLAECTMKIMSIFWCLMYIGIGVRGYGGGTAWDRVEMGQSPFAPPTQDVQVNWIYWVRLWSAIIFIAHALNL